MAGPEPQDRQQPDLRETSSAPGQPERTAGKEWIKDFMTREVNSAEPGPSIAETPPLDGVFVPPPPSLFWMLEDDEVATKSYSRRILVVSVALLSLLALGAYAYFFLARSPAEHQPPAVRLSAEPPVIARRAAAGAVAAPAIVSQRPVTPAPVSQRPVAPAPASRRPVAPVPASRRPVAPVPASRRPVTPAPVSQRPVAPAPVSQRPVAPAPVSQRPVVPAPVALSGGAASPVIAPPRPAPIASEPDTLPTGTPLHVRFLYTPSGPQEASDVAALTATLRSQLRDIASLGAVVASVKADAVVYYFADDRAAASRVADSLARITKRPEPILMLRAGTLPRPGTVDIRLDFKQWKGVDQ